MMLLRAEAAAPIRWQCSVCDDTGVISNWEDSLFDLRRRRLVVAEPSKYIVVAHEVEAALVTCGCSTLSANDWSSAFGQRMPMRFYPPPTTNSRT